MVKPKKTSRLPGEPFHREKVENETEKAIRSGTGSKPQVIDEPEIALIEKDGYRIWQPGYKLKRNEEVTQHPNIYIGAIVVTRRK